MGVWNDVYDEKYYQEVNSDSGNKVPHGRYEVSVINMYPAKSKAGNDKLSAEFKILEGEYKGRVIYMHQPLHHSWPAKKAINLLRGLVLELPDIKVKNENPQQFETLVMDVFEAISGNYEYELEFGEDDKGYETFVITKVFPLTD